MDGRSVREMVNSLMNDGRSVDIPGGGTLYSGPGPAPKMPLKPGEIQMTIEDVIHVKPIGMVIARGRGDDGETLYMRFFQEHEGIMAMLMTQMMKDVKSMVSDSNLDAGAALATPRKALLTKHQFETLKGLA